MHQIEPYYKWREIYIASEDDASPFYGQTYNEFQFTQKIYNYFIHPQWDNFGSATLYTKILYVDYHTGYCILEFIGEWNDAVNNDIMFIKRELVDQLLHNGINKFILLCDNILNFHGDEDCYYEEWKDDLQETKGWVCLVNLQEHVYNEMEQLKLSNYINLGDELYDLSWQQYTPQQVYDLVKNEINAT